MFLLLISIIVGITEFLPVSSTAHILLMKNILDVKNITIEYMVSVQLGAISAIFIFYFNRIKVIVKEIFTLKPKLITTLTIVSIPTLVCGLILHSTGIFQKIPFFIININLIIGGIVMLIFANKQGLNDDIMKISYKESLKIGLFQIFSLIPGVSRSFSVILGGLFSNLTRPAALEIALLSGFPIMLAATVLEISEITSTIHIMFLFKHMFVAFLFSCFSVFAIKKVVKYHNTFIIFGFYRIIIGTIALCFLI